MEQTREQRRAMAIRELNDHYDHKRRDPDNCIGCAHQENPPNVAGWLRVWIAAGNTIPAEHFVTEITYAQEENQAYFKAILQEVKDFGLTVERSK